MPRDQLDDAVAEAERRARLSDREMSASVRHFETEDRSVCHEWGLTVERLAPGRLVSRPRAKPWSCRPSWRTWVRATGPATRTCSLREEGRRLAEVADVDPERVRRWAFVERVTTGLYLRWHGHARQSVTFLDTAALLVTSAGGS